MSMDRESAEISYRLTEAAKAAADEIAALSEALEMLKDKVDKNPAKKHGNIPL